MSLSPPPDDTLLACYSCGWVGSPVEADPLSPLDLAELACNLDPGQCLPSALCPTCEGPTFDYLVHQQTLAISEGPSRWKDPDIRCKTGPTAGETPRASAPSKCPAVRQASIFAVPGALETALTLGDGQVVLVHVEFRDEPTLRIFALDSAEHLADGDAMPDLILTLRPDALTHAQEALTAADNTPGEEPGERPTATSADAGSPPHG